jgi:hypothetical protein
VNRETRTRAGRCQVCSVRVEAWFCLSCSFNSDYWSARESDNRRAATATSLSRALQRRVGDQTAYEQTLLSARDGMRREWDRRGLLVRQRDVRDFTQEEQRRWTDALCKLDPIYRAEIERRRARTVAIAQWSASRKWTLFCAQWTSVGLEVLADYFAGTSRKAKVTRRARRAA